jgi:hypothetical protein
LILVVLGISLCTLAPLRADPDYHPKVEEVHGLLKQAMGGDSGIPPEKAQITDLLKKALGELMDIPPGHWGGHLKQARFLVKGTLDAISQGESDDKVQEDIRDADAEVRDME